MTSRCRRSSAWVKCGKCGGKRVDVRPNWKRASLACPTPEGYARGPSLRAVSAEVAARGHNAIRQALFGFCRAIDAPERGAAMKVDQRSGLDS
jgi:hypothetical protein